MTKEEAELLIDKYLDNKADARERALVERWYMQQSDEKQLTETDDFEHFNAELWAGTKRRAGIGVSKPTIKLWPRIVAVAAAIATIVFGVWFFNSGSGILTHNLVYANDIRPGKNTATLTLANGKVITLDTNKSSVVVTDSISTLTMLTASTPPRGTYQVVLPDGSKVWLNSDSKISFPSQFTGKERKISLYGEGYFEVYKNKAMPFIVESGGQRIEVLGTHFNVNAYEEAIRTTLLEGSVLVRDLNSVSSLPDQGRYDDHSNIILKPGEQSSLMANQQIKVRRVDVDQIVDWKNGMIIFEHQNIEEIMKKISRWYGITVFYDKDVNTQSTFSGKISRASNISAVLKSLESTGLLTFKIDRNIIYVSK